MDEQRPTVIGALVGRQRQLSETRKLIDAALAGSGGLVVVTGEAGIGKTRLVDELTGTLAALTLRGTSWNDPGTPPFWPWTTVLRDCAAALGLEIGEDLAPIFGRAEVIDEPDHQLRLRLFERVAAFLTAAAASRPIVIVLDDLHFADAASLDLLRFLATSQRDKAIAFVGTYRYPDLDPGLPLADVLAEVLRVARSVPLLGLDEDEVGDLIHATTGHAPDGHLAARIRDHTGGNPLFVVEFAKLLALQASTDVERFPIPSTVQQVIAHRLGYISGDALDVLAQASVVGQVFTLPVLAQVMSEPLGRIADLLDEAVRAGLVQPLPAPAGFGFMHALIHDVLYAGVPIGIRRARHRLVAEAIEDLYELSIDEHLDELTEHYTLALPDADDLRALQYLRRAGSRSLDMLAFEEAARRFATAVEVAATAHVDESVRVEVLLDLGDARMRAGDWPGAVDAYEQVAMSARRRNRPEELARAALGLGAGLSGFEVRLFDQRQLDLLWEALHELGESDSELRTWVLARLSVAESFISDEVVRVGRSRQAVEEARRAGNPNLLSYALSSYCDAIAGPDHTEERLMLADEMVRLGVEAHDLKSELLGRRFRAVALMESGDLASVEAEADAFALAAEQLGWALVQWYPLLWRGTLALVDGRVGEVEKLIREVEDIGRRGGSVNAGIVADAQRLQLLLEQGRAREAYAVLRPFLDDPQGGPNAAAWRALPLVRMGRRAEASAVIDRLAANDFDLVMDAAWLEVIASVAEACVEVGDQNAARQLLPIIAPYADRFATGGTGAICFGSMHRHAGLLAHCAGELDRADEHFHQALQANRRAGATLLVAHTQRQHADLLHDRGGPEDGAAANDMLGAAHDAYRQLGLDHWDMPGQEGSSATAVFRRDGDVWMVAYQDRDVHVANIKGMAVLGQLLAQPGREFHVLDLVSEDAAVRTVRSGDTGEVIDAQARQAYRRRLDELEAEIDDAELSGDVGQSDRAQAERDILVEQLTTAYGLAGRARRGNDPIERARTTVAKRIRSAIARIGKEHPSLALHLTNSIRTGRYCCYAPEHPVSWTIKT